MQRLGWLIVLVACGELGPLDVKTDHGVVRGSDDGNGVRSFLGIPYAAPPIGSNRWRPPQPAADWDGVRDATLLGQKCPQNTVITAGGGNEDCLFLNVWTPSPQPVNAPVMVWIHGGAFVFGSGGDAFYAGSELARRHGVVVVTINYRLGGLGFLAHPELSAEDPDHPASGNYGLMDQLAALEWVHRNIAELGGDPDRVTLFGESAGGYSTCLHYATATEDLFYAAISESGACAATALEQPRAQAEADGVALATKLGCSDIACMRGKSDYEILDATALPPIAQQLPGGFFYAEPPKNTLPNVDGVVLPASVEMLLATRGGRPLIVGNNANEGTLFHSTILSNAIKTEAEYSAALERRFGANAQAILLRYPVNQFATPNAALAEVSGDAFFVCPARRTVRKAVANGAPVYRYIFSRSLEQELIADLGAFHSAEIPFVFGVDAFPLGKVGSAAPLSESMQGYWTRFAATGDPNGNDVVWPRADASDSHIVLDVPITTGTAYKSELCDFWDAL